MNPAVLVFDLDGTLVPTMEDYADKAASLMEENFGTPWEAARRDYFRTSGLPFEKQLRQLYPERPDTDSVADRFEEWKDGYLRTVQLPDAVRSMFVRWRDEGIRIAVSSNNLEVYVERMAREWPVDCALGYRREGNFGKGEDHFAALESHFGIPRREFLFIGDSPNDARIALGAGVRFRGLMTAAFTAADFHAIDPGIVLLRNLDEAFVSLHG